MVHRIGDSNIKSMHPVFVLEAGRRERHYWLDLWHYRELFLVLAWRDLSVRYKQTIIGVAWAVIRPFLTMVVFTIVFGRIAKLPSEGTAPYAHGICGYVAMDLFFDGIDRSV